MSEDNKNIFITSHNQMGGVTAQTVNFGPQQRQMNSDIETQLKENISTSAGIEVITVMGDGEAFQFANQITQWLKSNGYKNVNGVTQSVFQSPQNGQKLIKESDNDFKLIIGNNS